MTPFNGNLTRFERDLTLFSEVGWLVARTREVTREDPDEKLWTLLQCLSSLTADVEYIDLLQRPNCPRFNAILTRFERYLTPCLRRFNVILTPF